MGFNSGFKGLSIKNVIFFQQLILIDLNIINVIKDELYILLSVCSWEEKQTPRDL